MYYKTMKTSLVIGVSTEYKITPDLAVSGAFAYDLLINPLFKTTANRDNVLLHNFNLQLGIKYVL
ncbi:hypothetical protein FACS189461_5620 [Spirochaetia bacterium]|nr:hypothetical protein FACS189461_5620 [Spirochaetia bacterium]